MAKKPLTTIQYTILECLITKKEAKMNAIIKFCNSRISITTNSMFKPIVTSLIKKKLVTLKENSNSADNTKFIITDLGLKEWEEKPDNWKNQLPKQKKVEQEGKERQNLPKKAEKQENWMEFTQPIFVVANNQWEFYQKQGEEIQNIFSSLDEEEIKRMHQAKIMEHITAAMHNPSKKKEKDPNIPYRTKERYVDIDSNPRLRIMEMKLGGYTAVEILEECTNRFNLNRFTVGMYLTEVLADIRKMAKDILLDSIISHSDRYENMYKWFSENGYDKMSIKVLERREKLLGFHDSETVNGLIGDFISSNTLQNKPKYNFNKLSTNEMEKLESLVKKCIIILKPSS